MSNKVEAKPKQAIGYRQDKSWIKDAQVGDRVVIVGHGYHQSVPAVFLGRPKMVGGRIVLAGTDGYNTNPGCRLALRKVYHFDSVTLREEADRRDYVHYYSLEKWDDVWEDWFARKDLLYELKAKVRLIDVATSPLSQDQMRDMLAMIGDVRGQLRPKSKFEQKYDPSEITLGPHHIEILKATYRLGPNTTVTTLFCDPELHAKSIKSNLRSFRRIINRLTAYGYMTITYEERLLENPFSYKVPRTVVKHFYSLSDVGCDVIGVPRLEFTDDKSEE